MKNTRMRGWTNKGFEPLGRAFSTLLNRDEKAGAALAVYWKGLPVVDVWGGYADLCTGRLWEEQTLAIAFSCGKGLLAMCCYTLVEAGALDLDEPVGSYWPNFSREGKGDITTRQVLSHRSGLPMVPPQLTLPDLALWSTVSGAYEDQVPLWPPGTLHGYHTLSVGWLAGEVVRRVSGMTPREYLSERIARPLGAELSYGTAEVNVPRVAALQFDPGALPGPIIEGGKTWDEISLGSLFPDGLVAGMSDRSMLSVEVPAANLVTDARSLARVYAAAVADVDGIRILAEGSLVDCRREQSSGMPWRGATPTGYRWGTGFMLDSPPVRPMLTAGSFGHDGAGGSLGFGDPELEVGFGFVTNRFNELSYRSADALVASLRECLGGL